MSLHLVCLLAWVWVVSAGCGVCVGLTHVVWLSHVYESLILGSSLSLAMAMPKPRMTKGTSNFTPGTPGPTLPSF